MARLILLTAGLVMLGALAGCASTTLSADECRAADWRAKGVADGELGRTAAYFSRYVEECAGAATPDRTAWSAGRAQGLSTFCTQAGAYAAGREGQEYAGVCPDPVDPEILEANSHGLTWRTMRDRIAELERLERDTRFNCPAGIGRIGRWDRCAGASGGGFGYDPAVQAELRRLRQDLAHYASWPPPRSAEAIGF